MKREELVSIRKKKYYTQATLAEKVGVKREFIAQIETGNSQNPSLRSALDIADALGIKTAKELRRVFLPENANDNNENDRPA